MENRKHSNGSYIIYSQANRGGSGFLKVGQLVNGTKTPFSTQVFSFSSKGPFPGVFCGPAWAPQDKAFPPRLTERESSRGCFWARPPPRTRWKPSSTAAHIWHPARLEPRRARLDPKPLRGETPGRPRPRPPPPRRGALSGRSGRTPGRRQAEPSWGPSPRTSAAGAGASSRGGQGPRGGTGSAGSQDARTSANP